MPRNATPHFCTGDTNPIEKDCPDCVDKLYEWAKVAQDTIYDLMEALKDAVERLEASQPEKGSATARVIEKCYIEIRKTVPDYA
jgi:hypothetical protein